jgi:hypothetical protein
LGLLPHWTPGAFIRSVKAAVPATAGVLIQFPFLCRHFWHGHQILDLALDGQVLYPDFYARHLSGADRCLLRCSWVVRAFGGKQVAFAACEMASRANSDRFAAI